MAGGPRPTLPACELQLVTRSATRPERPSRSAGLLAARAEETAAVMEEASAPARAPACVAGGGECYGETVGHTGPVDAGHRCHKSRLAWAASNAAAGAAPRLRT